MSRRGKVRQTDLSGIGLWVWGLGWLGTGWLAGLPSANAKLPFSTANPSLTRSACPTDVETLTAELMRDLPSYANRASQRNRQVRKAADVSSTFILAGRPEFTPLPLPASEYVSATPVDIKQPQQVFLTTLERQYTLGKAINFQEFHWLFLTPVQGSWTLIMMFSQTGSALAEQPPTPPRDSSQGVVAQAIQTWLGDCQAGSIRPLSTTPSRKHP